MTDLHLLSFATTSWPKSKARLSKQLSCLNNNLKIFSRIDLLSEHDLPAEYTDFFNAFAHDVGYAMWSWKPYIICQKLNAMPENDYLLYVDGGCDFSSACSNEFADALAMHICRMDSADLPFAVGYHPADIKNIGIQAKYEIMQKFNLERNFDFIKNWHHYEAGVILMKNTKPVREFVREWYCFMRTNYVQIFSGDRTSKENQYPFFVANNGDQPVLQCMLYSSYKDKFYDIGAFWYKYRIYARIKG